MESLFVPARTVKVVLIKTKRRCAECKPGRKKKKKDSEEQDVLVFVHITACFFFSQLAVSHHRAMMIAPFPLTWWSWWRCAGPSCDPTPGSPGRNFPCRSPPVFRICTQKNVSNALRNAIKGHWAREAKEIFIGRWESIRQIGHQNWSIVRCKIANHFVDRRDELLIKLWCDCPKLQPLSIWNFEHLYIRENQCIFNMHGN